jgi:hypothetical protein
VCLTFWREEKVRRGIERRYILRREGNKKFSALKVPRQCPLVFLVEERLREGKVLGSEKVKGLGCELRYGQRREVEQGP